MLQADMTEDMGMGDDRGGQAMVVRTCIACPWERLVTNRHDGGHGDREVTEVDRPRT